jgi:transglutaminase-like putative cysteine protease
MKGIKKLLNVLFAVSLAVGALLLYGGANEALAETKDGLPMPAASGKEVKQNEKASVDASNTKDGYVMVKYTAGGQAGIKVRITGPSSVAYSYNLNSGGSYEVFPLSDGNGEYLIGVYKNVSGTQYATEYTTNLKVNLSDTSAPFLLPNQYVNYNEDTQAVKMSAELTADVNTTLEKVHKIYNYVISNFTYDKQLAATVKSGYLPDLDKVWNKKSGICFDYAATMTAMLRSQGIPSKLVVGYTSEAYHAWISVYTTETGTVASVIHFDGKNWKLMDPTFASSSKSSESIMKYIGDGKNYSAKYHY